jgi:hypothetical protein
MTLVEFKAWFQGFTENMNETPTQSQWDRIVSRVKEIDGTVTTQTVFVDRYWQHTYPFYVPLPVYSNPPTTIISNTVGSNGFNSDLGPSFDSAQAMYALGTTDAASTV